MLNNLSLEFRMPSTLLAPCSSVHQYATHMNLASDLALVPCISQRRATQNMNTKIYVVYISDSIQLS